MIKQALICLCMVFSAPSIAYWYDASGGHIPMHAEQIGVNPDGAPLFMCKGLYDGTMYQGLIHADYGGCEVSVNGNIITLPRYTVWVDRPS